MVEADHVHLLDVERQRLLVGGNDQCDRELRHVAYRQLVVDVRIPAREIGDCRPSMEEVVDHAVRDLPRSGQFVATNGPEA